MPPLPNSKSFHSDVESTNDLCIPGQVFKFDNQLLYSFQVWLVTLRHPQYVAHANQQNLEADGQGGWDSLSKLRVVPQRLRTPVDLEIAKSPHTPEDTRMQCMERKNKV